MKLFLAFLLVSGSMLLAAQARAYEIATVMGQPDPHLLFVQELVKQSIVLTSPAEADWTTAQYSILSRNRVRSAVSVSVVDDDGASVTATVIQGLGEGSKLAPIVLFDLGPLTDAALCSAMEAQSPETVFVVPAGAEGSVVPAQSCSSGNVIRVGALRTDLGDLADFSNFGAAYINVAAPGQGIRVTMAGGKLKTAQGTSLAASLVAARLVSYMHAHPGLAGAALAQSFLAKATYALPALSGKVQASRAIR